MGTAFSLEVPEDARTLETGTAFYRYHIEHSEHDSDLSDLLEYKLFKDELEDENFSIFRKATRAVTEAAEPPLSDIQQEFCDEELTVRDPAGLDAFVRSLEAARENLELESDGDIHVGTDRTIDMCINIVEFARERGWGVHYG